ncbi:MAG: hypothetical protein WDN23_04600 [Edaphobacter sp.]
MATTTVAAQQNGFTNQILHGDCIEVMKQMPATLAWQQTRQYRDRYETWGSVGGSEAHGIGLSECQGTQLA